MSGHSHVSMEVARALLTCLGCVVSGLLFVWTLGKGQWGVPNWLWANCHMYLDILGRSESWLHSYISDSSVGILGFDIIRWDAVESSHTGLAVYVNHCLRDSLS